MNRAGKQWTVEEIELLKRRFPFVGADIYKELGRSYRAVQNKAADLGLKGTRSANRKWSASEIAALEKIKGLSNEEKIKLIPGRSLGAISVMYYRIYSKGGKSRPRRDVPYIIFEWENIKDLPSRDFIDVIIEEYKRKTGVYPTMRDIAKLGCASRSIINSYHSDNKAYIAVMSNQLKRLLYLEVKHEL